MNLDTAPFGKNSVTSQTPAPEPLPAVIAPYVGTVPPVAKGASLDSVSGLKLGGR